MVPGTRLVLQHPSDWCRHEASWCDSCVSHLLMQLAVPTDVAPARSQVVHHFCLMRDARSLFPAWWLSGCDPACDGWFQPDTSNIQDLFSTDIGLFKFCFTLFWYKLCFLRNWSMSSKMPNFWYKVIYNIPFYLFNVRTVVIILLPVPLTVK